MSQRIPAEAFPLSEYLREEMDAGVGARPTSPASSGDPRATFMRSLRGRFCCGRTWRRCSGMRSAPDRNAG